MLLDCIVPFAAALHEAHLLQEHLTMSSAMALSGMCRNNDDHLHLLVLRLGNASLCQTMCQMCSLHSGQRA